MDPQTSDGEIVYDYVTKNWAAWSKGLFHALSTTS